MGQYIYIVFNLNEITSALYLWEMIVNMPQRTTPQETDQTQNTKGGKDQESIQSSTTPDPGYHM